MIRALRPKPLEFGEAFPSGCGIDIHMRFYIGFSRDLGCYEIFEVRKGAKDRIGSHSMNPRLTFKLKDDAEDRLWELNRDSAEG